MAVIGVDIGGSGIKGALVDIRRGELVGDRFRVDTPEPSNPKSVVAAVGEVVRHFEQRPDSVGITFPGVIRNGVVRTAANVDKSWMNTNGAQLFAEELHCPVALINDADAAGMAEMRFGAGKGRKGTVVMLTFGTGIGSAVFIDGMLVPNTEFGHIKMHGVDAEKRAAARVRQDEDLGWGAWSKRVRKYLQHLEQLLSPDLFIVGGGVSRKSDQFLSRLDIETPVVPAMLLNNAGIIGAALATAQARDARALADGRAGATPRTTGAAARPSASADGDRPAAASPTGARKAAKTSTARKSTGARKSTAARKSTGARKSTAPRKSTGARKSTAPRKSTGARKSTTPSKSTTARKSAGARKSTTARKSTGARKSAGARKSTAASKAASPRRSTAASKATAASKSATARTSTASAGPARRSGTPRKTTTTRGGAGRRSTSAREATSTRKATPAARKTTGAARTTARTSSTARRSPTKARKRSTPRNGT